MGVLQVERDWQWKLESKEQEIASLTARARQVGEALPAVLLVQHLCSVPLLHTTMFKTSKPAVPTGSRRPQPGTLEPSHSPACLPGPAALLLYFILALLPAAVGG